ncbi:MAG: hypothetical protein ABIT09_05370 [Croceibacterium sp.]
MPNLKYRAKPKGNSGAVIMKRLLLATTILSLVASGPLLSKTPPSTSRTPSFPNLAACEAKERVLTAQVDAAEQMAKLARKASAAQAQAETKSKALWRQLEAVGTACLQLQLGPSASDTAVIPSGNAEALARLAGGDGSLGRGDLARSAGAGSSSTYGSEGARRRASEVYFGMTERKRLQDEQQAQAAEARRISDERMLAAEREQERAEDEASERKFRSRNSFLGILGSIATQTVTNIAGVAAARAGASSGYNAGQAQYSSPAPSGDQSLESACPGLLARIEQESAGMSGDNSGSLCSNLRTSLNSARRSADVLRQCSHHYAQESLHDMEATIASQVQAAQSSGCGSL